MSQINFKELVTDSLMKARDLDNNYNVLFNRTQEQLKDTLTIKSGVKSLITLVDEVADEIHSSKGFTTRVKNIIKLAGNAKEFKLIIDSNKLFFYNVEKAVSLLNYLRVTTDVTTVNKVKNKLNRIKPKEDEKGIMTSAKKRIFNDEYAKVLKELYKEYKVVMSDEGSLVKISMTKEGLDTLVGELSEELKAYLLEKLQATTDTQEVA